MQDADNDNGKQKNRQQQQRGWNTVVILSLLAILLAGLVAAYVGTTANLYLRLQQLEGQQLSSRTGTLEDNTTQLQQNVTVLLNRLEMLETKEMSLQTRLNRVELDSVANVSVVETGKCLFYTPGKEVDYTLYSYTTQNLTHYFVEFGGNTTVVGAAGTSTSEECSSTEYTGRAAFFIYGCSVVYPSYGTPSMINALYDNSFAVGAFRPEDISKFSSPDAGPVIVSYAPTTWSSCAPGTYRLAAAMLPGTQIDGFQLLLYVYFVEPITFPTLVVAPGIRIPLRGAFSITKK